MAHSGDDETDQEDPPVKMKPASAYSKDEISGKFGERIVFQMFAHGISQSLLSGVSGGDMLQSFVSGALSSIVSSAWSGGDNVGECKGVGGNFARKDIGILVFSTAAGAGGAALTKGTIWQGAEIGLVVSGLNHVAHQVSDDGASIKIRKDIVAGAEAELNSTDYDVENRNGLFAEGTNKCNQFVSDITSGADASAGTPNGRFGLSPLTAGQWADPNYNIDNWKVVSSARAGDVVARARNYRDATGHVAIMNSKSSSIGAGTFLVHKTDFGYGQSHLAMGESYVYRRYFATTQQRFNYQLYNWINTKRR